MAAHFDYSSPSWRALAAQAVARDGHRCTVARLIGGRCSQRLDAHHVVPVSEDESLALDLDNVITACAHHHPRVEALRRYILRERQPIRCTHYHPYPHGRAECERRLALRA